MDVLWEVFGALNHWLGLCFSCQCFVICGRHDGYTSKHIFDEAMALCGHWQVKPWPHRGRRIICWWALGTTACLKEEALPQIHCLFYLHVSTFVFFLLNPVRCKNQRVLSSLHKLKKEKNPNQNTDELMLRKVKVLARVMAPWQCGITDGTQALWCWVHWPAWTLQLRGLGGLPVQNSPARKQVAATLNLLPSNSESQVTLVNHTGVSAWSLLFQE